MASDFFISNAAQQPRMLRLGASATAHGPEFEWMLSGLLALRAQRRDIRFQIFSNVHVARPCDDVVMRLPDHGLTFFIQLKHSRAGVKGAIGEQAMITEKGDFSIPKYFEFYQKLCAMYVSPKNDDARLLTELPLEGVRFVLFTTKSVERKDNRGQRGRRETQAAEGARGTDEAQRGNRGNHAKGTKGGGGAKRPGQEEGQKGRGNKTERKVHSKGVKEAVNAKGVEGTSEEQVTDKAKEEEEVLKVKEDKSERKANSKGVKEVEGTGKDNETEKKEGQKVKENKTMKKADSKSENGVVGAKKVKDTGEEQGTDEANEEEEAQKVRKNKSERKVESTSVKEAADAKEEEGPGKEQETDEAKEDEEVQKVKENKSERKADSKGVKKVESTGEETETKEKKDAQKVKETKTVRKEDSKSEKGAVGAKEVEDNGKEGETEEAKETEENHKVRENKRERKMDSNGVEEVVGAMEVENTREEQGTNEPEEEQEEQEMRENKSDRKMDSRGVEETECTMKVEGTGEEQAIEEANEREEKQEEREKKSERKVEADAERRDVKNKEGEKFLFEDLFYTGERGSEDVFSLNSEYKQVWSLFSNDPGKEQIYHDDFFPKLRIFDNQSTSDQLGPIIEKEMKEIYGAEANYILKTFNAFLRKWSEELTQNFCLSNDTLFDFLEHRLRQRALQRIGQGLTFTAPALEPLRARCASLRCPGAPTQLRICVRGAPDPGRRAAKLLQALQADELQHGEEEEGRNGSWAYLDGELLRGVPESTLAVAAGRCHTILTDLKDSAEEKLSSRLLVAAGSSVREVALRAAGAGTADVEDEWRLSQLDDAAQQWMLWRRITFQGNVMWLKRLEASWPKMREDVDAEMLLAMDEKEGVEIGRAFPALEKGLLPRRMAHSSVVSASVLTEASLGGGQLALGGFPKTLLTVALANALAPTLRGSPAAQDMDLVETQWTILNYRGEPTPKVNKETLQALAKKRGLSSIHHLEYITGDTMEDLVMVWKDSYGNLDALCSWVLPVTTDCCQVLLCRHLSSFSLRHYPVALLLGEAGVGKTTVIEKAAVDFKIANSSHWVVLVKLLDHRDILRKWQEERGRDRGVQGALDLLCAAAGARGATSRRCLEAALLHSDTVSVLVDGVDEVSPAFSLQVLQLLRLLRTEMRVRRLWVASRPEQEAWLRDALRCPPLRLLPLSTAEQRRLLCARWADAEGREDFAARVVEWLGAQAGGLLATPLHLEMAAEAFALDPHGGGGGALFENQVTLLRLYSTFVEKKRRLFQERHLNLVFMENLPFTDDFQKRHENCAMLFLFSDGNYEDDLPFDSFRKYVEQNKKLLQEKEKFGIVWMDKTGKVIFIHQTFAEYFAAVWLWKSYGKMTHELTLSDKSNQRDRCIEVNQCEDSDSSSHLSLLDIFSQPEKSEKYDQLNQGDHMNTLENSYQLENVVRSSQSQLSKQSNKVDEMEQFNQWNSRKQYIQANTFGQLNPLEQGDESECLVPRRFVHALCRESHRTVLLGFLQDMLGDRWPLHAAAWRQDFQAVERLLGAEWGAHRWEERDPLLGWTPLQCMESAGMNKGSALHRAAAAGSVATLEVLLGRRDINGRDHLQRTPLHRAVYGRNLKHHHAATQRLLREQGLNLNAVDADGATPLNRAVAFDCRECVEVLLHKGARVQGGSRPLVFVAALNNSINVLRFLLDNGFPPDVTDPKGFTPLQVAIQVGFPETVRVLLECGANVDTRSVEGWTAAHSAAANGRLEELRILLAHGASLHACSEDQFTPLHTAAEHGHTELVALLLEHGSPVDPVNEDGCTPVHSAAMGGHTSTLELLLSHGACADTRSLIGLTPIHIAACKGHFDAVKVLLTHGASADCAGKDGGTPALMAAGDNHTQCLKVLLEAGASPSKPNEDGLTPMHVAAGGGHVDVLKLLLAHGASVDEETPNGATALHLAVENRRMEAVQLLLARGARVRSSEDSGWTPVHSAAANGSAAALRLLLLHGGQVDIPGPQGLTPLHCAAKGGHTEAIRILVASGVAVSERCPRGFTPLHWAAFGCKAEAATVLLELGTPIDVQSAGGWTPVHAAAQGDSPAVLQLLLERGASARAGDADGDTPLHVAANGGRLEVVAALLAAGADAGARNVQGKTPADAAKEAGHELCARLLEERALGAQSFDVPGASSVREAISSRTIPVLSGGSKWTGHSVYKVAGSLEGAWSQIFFENAEAEELD